jgi:hypothetical protein
MQHSINIHKYEISTLPYLLGVSGYWDSFIKNNLGKYEGNRTVSKLMTERNAATRYYYGILVPESSN